MAYYLSRVKQVREGVTQSWGGQFLLIGGKGLDKLTDLYEKIRGHSMLTFYHPIVLWD
jgi:hypothetical protein